MIAEILRDYLERLDSKKKLFSLVLGLILLLCPFLVQAEEEAPKPEQMSEDALNYLLSEDMNQ